MLKEEEEQRAEKWYPAVELGLTRQNTWKEPRLEIIVKDSDAKKVVDIILTHAKTGNVGDGKIFVSNVEQGYDITSGIVGEGSIASDEAQSFAVKARI